MIHIKRHHYARFCNLKFLSFKEELAAEIEKLQPHSDARSLAEEIINKSFSYSITSENDIRYIMKLVLKEGKEFETLPHNKKIKEILENKFIAGDERIHEIHKQLIEAQLGY